MRNFDDALSQVVHAALVQEPAAGAVFAFIGPVGIGKSFLLDAIEESCEGSSLVVRFDGVDAPSPSLEPIYAGLFKAVTVGERFSAFGRQLLEKYVKLIPGFGQYLEPVVAGLNHAGASEALRRRGLALSTSPATHIARMLAEASQGRPVVILCDNIEWLDDESWLCVVRLAETARSNHIVLAIACSTDSTPGTPRLEELSRYRAAPSHSHWSFITPESWPMAETGELCDLLVARHCRFSEDELAELYAASGGLPLYAESIIRALAASGHVIVPEPEGDVTSAGSWPALDLEHSLKSHLIARIKSAYGTISRSRDTLEAASVLGDPFVDAPISRITDVDDPFGVLSLVERGSSLVSYYVEERFWRFSHGQVRRLVYESLGGGAIGLHRRLADFYQGSENTDPSVVAYHLERSGNVADAIPYRVKEVQSLLQRGVFLSARLVAEHAIELSDSMGHAIEPAVVSRLMLCRAKALYGEFRFKESLAECRRLADHVRDRHDLADTLRWIGRCYVKLDKQEDFDAACKHLNEARKEYADLGDIASEADTLSDIVAAEAHRNRYAESREAFVAAEALYNQLSDRIGMARLQRRNLIFIDPQLALPIQHTLARSFRDFGMPHEEIMAMNNEASLLLYDNRIDEAQAVLERALVLSADLSGFGTDYICNNLAITHALLRDFAGARHAIAQARSHNARAVMALIVDSTESVLAAVELGPSHALPLLEAVARQAQRVGEYAYLQPAFVNLAIALARVERYSDAIEALKQAPPRRDCTFPRYKFPRWYAAFSRILNATKTVDQLRDLETTYGWAHAESRGAYESFEYAFTSTQFWSD